METISELTSMLRFVLPGLVVAWVFYGLTSYERPNEFERIAQALVFTALLDALARVTIAGGVWLGARTHPLLPTPDTGLVATALAIPMGVVVAYITNNDVAHSWLRRHEVTTKTGHPDQWDTAFRVCGPYAVLDLADGRRLLGWLSEWPDRPGQGHFLLRSHRWIDNDGRTLFTPASSAILISAKEVARVEFLEKVEESGA